MNLLLLRPEEISGDGIARLGGRRARHAREVLGAAPGDTLVAGVLRGAMGTAQVLSVSDEELVVSTSLDRPPPPRAPVDLLLALPRPKILRRVLQHAASLGVGRIVLVGSWHVEKSYWGSPALEPARLDDELLLGLEQARDTVPPQLDVRRFFKPFVEDELEHAFAGCERLLAHNAASAPIEQVVPRSARAVLAIGPEGGWTPYEAARLREHGFADFSFGARALRVDAAVAYGVGQVELWLRAATVRGA